MSADPGSETWPELPLETWKDTYQTLHLWTQIVGKIRTARMPWVNHSWASTLYTSARGLTTSRIPTAFGAFEIEFDLLADQLVISLSDGRRSRVALEPRSVADFHSALTAELERLGLATHYSGRPNELADAIPFAEDREHSAYDGEQARRLWRALLKVEGVLEEFRAGFVGKCSPVHFFWGGFDLAVTRFSGRPAPNHPGGVPNLPDWIAREAYSHEVSSAGFWPGGEPHPFPLLYSYAYPEPEGFAEAAVEPEAAFYSTALREFVLPYDAVRTAADPKREAMRFLESTYAAAAELGGWDRAALERQSDPRLTRRG